MKNNIFASSIILMILCSTIISSANVNQTNPIEIKPNNSENVIDIKIARLSLNIDRPGIFEYILEDYQWMVGNKTYNFIVEQITDKDILRGKLTTENYDVLVMPYFEAEMELIFRSHPSIRNYLWKTKVTNFVKSGGGFIGNCGPTLLTSDIYGKPKTLVARLANRFDLDISRVDIILENGLPFISQLTGKPELIGPSAYLFYRGMYIPLEVTINKNTPIFDDLIEDTRIISWCAGPALIPPENSGEDITVLAYYPEEEISDNVSTQIHAWKYTGGIRGLIKGFIKARIIRYPPVVLPAACYLAKDWELTDKIIQTNHSSKPFMTMETYPNENQGRIIISGGHPESVVFFGGHTEECEDTKYNSLDEGFYNYVDFKPWEETPEDEYTYNWWIIRRSVAWASKKVPENDLPPVYGYSQVNDLDSYNQSSNFIIEGNMQTSVPYLFDEFIEYTIVNVSLDLYYRYSEDNYSNWNDWELYKTDFDGSNGWSWEFDASELNETGYYQFHSIKHIKYIYEDEVIELNENAPPGPDAIIRVIEQ